ncbi:hypothetical protein [Haloglycomyces albus]|uniref:hypothetical protein n=1 Tax=Haloglycomyces albus TaxID=526067 RepID=UPI00046CC770|nr:hypothetical protein [Haloglycomyces albus]
MSFTDYADALHRLREDVERGAQERKADRDASTRRKREVDSLRDGIAREQDALVEACSQLRLQVPQEAVEPPEGDTEQLVHDGREAVREAGRLRLEAMRAAKLPSFLPRAHHVIREIVVYGIAMLGSLLFQLLALSQAGKDSESVWWIIALPPVAAAMVAWAVMNVVNRPRLAPRDGRGRPLQRQVTRNPRLGGAMALVTIAFMVYIVYFG